MSKFAEDREAPKCFECGEPCDGVTSKRCKTCMDKVYLENARRQRAERIEREGFETTGYDPSETDTCEYQVDRKVKNRHVTQPCGKPAMTVFKFAGPRNPEGIDVPLCRGCVGKFARELIRNMEYD